MDFYTRFYPVTIGIGSGVLFYPLTVYLHELGHASAAYLLFKNSNPKIKLKSYGYTGSCTYKDQSLSYAGKLMGFLGARAIVSAAGPLIEIIIAITLRCLTPEHPTVLGFRLWNELCLAIYAITSCSNLKVLYTGKYDDSAHGDDFLSVRIRGGLLPYSALIISTISLVALSCYEVKELV